MPYPYFSRNGAVLPIDQAIVRLDDVHYSYGFGVYETIRLSNGTMFFLEEHCERLMASAQAIDLTHRFSAEFIGQTIRELVRKNDVQTCNLKVLLIGGATAADATLYVMCLAPLFVDRALYKHGARAITQACERPFPQAKTLNMLPSYLAYRRAKAAGAYDALLVNRHGHITEGTRTNFFALKGRSLVTPPTADILPGVTRRHVLEVAQTHNFQVSEHPVTIAELGDYDSCFLTSTSSRILPLRTVDAQLIGPPSGPLQELMQAFRYSLKAVAGATPRPLQTQAID